MALIIDRPRSIPNGGIIGKILFKLDKQEYEFASSIIKKCYNDNRIKILNCACGYGYGSKVLYTPNREIYSIDIDNDTIFKAKGLFPHLKFKRMDALNTNFKDSTFDVIVSINTIEHIRDQHIFLSELQRILKPCGILIISTTNKKVEEYILRVIEVYLNKVLKYNSHHTGSLKTESFSKIISKYFKIRQQYVHTPSIKICFLKELLFIISLLFYRKIIKKNNINLGLFNIIIAKNAK